MQWQCLERVVKIIYLSFCVIWVSDFYAHKILVTGGAGFIGSHVVESLVTLNDEVVIIDNFQPSHDTGSKQYNDLKLLHLYAIMQKYTNQISFYKVDICDKKALATIFEKERPDCICHLAALAGICQSIVDPESFIQTNILGTVHILEMAKEYGVKHCVLASSSSVYGNTDQVPFVETQQTDMPASVYGATKKSLELFAYVYHHLYGISCTCLRFFTVYGPWGRFDMAPFLFMDAIHNERPITIFGDGTAVRDFVYITDLVDGIVHALKNPQGFQVLNLGSEHPIVLLDFIHILEKIIGKKAHIIHEPFFSGDVVATCADNTKAKEQIAYNPAFFIQEGMEKMYAWYTTILDYPQVSCII